jgi:hypothetical protein
MAGVNGNDHSDQPSCELVRDPPVPDTRQPRTTLTKRYPLSRLLPRDRPGQPATSITHPLASPEQLRPPVSVPGRGER